MPRQDRRVIMLADCQSFYASVEKSAHPEYKDRPSLLREIRRAVRALFLRPVHSPSPMELRQQNDWAKRSPNVRMLLLFAPDGRVHSGVPSYYAYPSVLHRSGGTL